MSVSRTIRRSLLAAGFTAVLAALILLAFAVGPDRAPRGVPAESHTAVAREPTGWGPLGHTARPVPSRADTPDPGAPYVAARVVGPPPPAPGARPLAVEEPVDPASASPPRHNPNGVNGRRPPRPIPGVIH